MNSTTKTATQIYFPLSAHRDNSPRSDSDKYDMINENKYEYNNIGHIIEEDGQVKAEILYIPHGHQHQHLYNLAAAVANRDLLDRPVTDIVVLPRDRS